MMHPQVFISGLILLLPGAVDSYIVVKGVVGHSVTLPCTYSARSGVFTACWGQKACPSFSCANTLIWTDGYRVSYQRGSRYQLKGHISKGNVSLTIEKAVQSDSGLYCCRVELPGWFNDQKVTFSLKVQPEIPTSTPTSPTTTRKLTSTTSPTTTGKPMKSTTTTSPTTTGKPMKSTTTTSPTTTGKPMKSTTTTSPTTTGKPMKSTTTTSPTTTGKPMKSTTTTSPTTTGKPMTMSSGTTHLPISSRVSTSTPTTPGHMQTHTPEPTTSGPHQTAIEATETSLYTLADWNYTVTSWDDSWNNYTELIPSQKLQKSTTKNFYIGISIAALLLLLLVCILAITRYILMKRKSQSLSLVAFQVSKIGALKNIAVVQSHVEDNVYIIEDSPYPTK